MRLTTLSSIRRAPKRQRNGRTQQEHQDLFVSISEGEAGLLHAPILWNDGTDFWLVAGEGRLAVIEEMHTLGLELRHEGEVIPEGMVPYTLVGTSSRIGIYEAEYDENVRRTPLSVADRAAATMQLFELKKMKAERDGLPAPTVADVAIELRGSAVGDYQENTRKELVVARHLDDPEVAAAKTLPEAFNIIKRKETQRKAAAIAKEMGTETRARGVVLHNADAIEWLCTAPSFQFDIVLSDPPYGMGADNFGVYNDSDDHRYDDSYEAWTALMAAIAPELDRVCKPDAHLYLFCDFDRFHALKRLLEQFGWTVHRTPIIWKNPTGFRTPWPEHGPQRKYELILYARRGEKKVLRVYPDVVEYARDKDSIHPAQKPVALLRDLLARSALPTDRVLDFCAGSASTLVACQEVGLEAVGIEKDATHYGAALQRLLKGK